MNRVMLMYPPGKLYQRGEDRAQCNIEDSAVTSIRACNDLGYAASVLRNGNYAVTLRDYQTEKTVSADIEKEIKSFSPDIIVISTTNATIYDDIAFVDWIKSFHICEFILKGAIFFDIPEKLLENFDLHNINYLIGGEIDFIIDHLADYITGKTTNIDNVPGIVYRKDNKFIKTAFDQWHHNLDDSPFPARDLMRNDLYVRPDTGEPMATIQVSRGCPANCTYCLTPIISGKKVRKRSIDNIFAEIEECYYKYNIKSFFFKADTFTIEPIWAEELCDKIINSDLNGKIKFTVNSRVKPLSFSLLEKLKKAGCFMFAVGFESSNDTTLQKIKKGTTNQDNISASKMIKKAKLPLFGYFMIGFPWETEEDIINTLKLTFKINPDFLEIHIAMPYLGTELYSQCEKYNTIKSEAWGNDYFSPNTIGTQTVPMRKIQKLRKKYLLKFYLRPSYLFKKIISCLSQPVVLKHYIEHGFKLLKIVLKK